MKNIILFFALLVFIGCHSSSELKKDFQCSGVSQYTGLSDIEDIRNLFIVSLPKNWKINLYFDDTQTSIYAADTTLNLTKATLFDVSLIHSPIAIDASFKQKISNDNSHMKLQEIRVKDFNLNQNTSYYSLAKGKKGKYPYHILNVFTKVNSDNFLHIKTEIYGDSLVDERICKAVNLIDKVRLK